MTKSVSRTKALLYKIALLPLISGLIYFMCIESIAQVTTPTNPTKKDDKIVYSTVIPNPTWPIGTVASSKSIAQSETSKDKQRDTYYAGVQIIVKDHSGNTIIDKQFVELTLAEKNRFLNLYNLEDYKFMKVHRNYTIK